MPDQALSDVKVLDFTHHVAGPYCTKLLADYGADVVKVERPGGGDLSRRMGPFPEDIPHGEKSGLFLHLNTNKRGITLDLGTQAAVKIVKELVKETDLVVESFRPGVMERFGLDYASLKEINPAVGDDLHIKLWTDGPLPRLPGSRDHVLRYGRRNVLHGAEGP